MIDETLERGEWVRLPRNFGYAEGQVIATHGMPRTIFGEPTSVVYFPDLGTGMVCPSKWLTPIEAPAGYPDAPKWNPTSEGHPEVERNKAEVDLVIAFIKMIEFGATDETCWCPWKPMQVDGRKGRLRTGEHPQCPLHTKEGYLFGFIDHVRRAFAAGKSRPELMVWDNETGQRLNPNPDESTVETLETNKANVRFL